MLNDALFRPVVGRPPISGVYFIQCGPFIKIGVASNLAQRLDSLLGQNPHDLIPLGFLPIAANGHLLERQLHDQFAAYRHRCEWFHEHLALVQFIGEYAQPWPTKSS